MKRFSKRVGSVGLLIAGILFSVGGHAAEAFTPEEFFDGRASSSGTVDSAFSDPEPFTAQFSGAFSNGVLKMDERYTFPDAQRLQRWTLKPDGAGGYTGSVQTETGDGALQAPRPVTGTTTPNGGVLTYDGYAPNGETVVLHFRHVITALSSGSVKNHVSVTRLGIPVGKADMVVTRE